MGATGVESRLHCLDVTCLMYHLMERKSFVSICSCTTFIMLALWLLMTGA